MYILLWSMYYLALSLGIADRLGNGAQVPVGCVECVGENVVPEKVNTTQSTHHDAVLTMDNSIAHSSLAVEGKHQPHRP